MQTPLPLLVAAQIIALFGFLFGLWQYMRTQTWKRLEFAAGVLDKLRSEPELKLAILFLDWRSRNIYLPDEYSAYIRDKKPFAHTFEKLAVAYDMNNRQIIAETGDMELKNEFLNNHENMIYVGVLDRFFEYLAQIQAFIELGVLKKEDVRSLHYWTSKLKDIRINNKSVFMPYLHHHEPNVIKLIDSFDKTENT